VILPERGAIFEIREQEGERTGHGSLLSKAVLKWNSPPPACHPNNLRK
jgi:hypothetical protein